MNTNFFVVGGPISVGKSTLVKSLGYPQIDELDENNKLQMLLLEATYKKNRVAPEVIESYFLQIRKDKYIEYANNSITHVFDRSIFESLWFAKGNLSHESFVSFERYWKSEIEKLINEYGKPKMYILLTMNWDSFKKRLFDRGREVEVESFSENEEFFMKHIDEYENHMIEVFKMFNLRYAVINTDDKTPSEVKEEALEILKPVDNV